MATPTDPSNTEAMNDDHSPKPAVSNSQLEIWKLEQELVASMVQVDEEPSIDTSTIPDNSLFHVIKDDHHDVYSFSSTPEFYGGVDVSFPEEEGNDAVAVYVIIDKRSMECIYRDHIYFSLRVPYVPTFLAFREIEPLQKLVLKQVEDHPDLTPKAILVDGNGILHPRHAGIACFLGTRTNIATIGIGKSLLYEGGWTREKLTIAIDQFLQNVHDEVMEKYPQTLPTRLAHACGTIVQRISTDLSKEETKSASDAKTVNRKELLKCLAPLSNGIAIPLKGDGDTRFPILGYAMVGHGGSFSCNSDKTKIQSGTVKPIFVSVGNRISLTEAVQITASLSLHRIPEPVRIADLYGRELIREKQKEQVAAMRNQRDNRQEGEMKSEGSNKGMVLF